MSAVCQNPACRKPLPPKDYNGPERRWCGDRCRKTQYHGQCGQCGSRTIGTAGGVDRAPEICRTCHNENEHQARKWTPEVIIAAIQRWTVLHGETPSAREWLTAEHASRREWPPCSVVQREFGSWSAGIAAAGFTPRRRGERKAMMS